MTANDQYQAARRKADGYAWAADDLGSARRCLLDIGDKERAAKVKAMENEFRELFIDFDNEAGELKPAAEKEFYDSLNADNRDFERGQ